MSPGKTPLISKLMLTALLLNLACLVVIIAQLKTRKESRPQPILMSENTPTNGSTEETPDRITYSPPIRQIRRTNIVSPPPSGLKRPQQRLTLETTDDSQALAGRPFDNAPPLNSGALAGASGYPIPGGITTARTQISGRVWLTGTPPAEIPIPLEATCGRQANPLTTRHYVVTEDGHLANVLVYVKDGLQKFRFPIPTAQTALLVRDCLFDPYVMGVQAGQIF